MSVFGDGRSLPVPAEGSQQQRLIILGKKERISSDPATSKGFGQELWNCLGLIWFFSGMAVHPGENQGLCLDIPSNPMV